MTRNQTANLESYIDTVNNSVASLLFGGDKWRTLSVPVAEDIQYIRLSLPTKSALHVLGIDLELENSALCEDVDITASSLYEAAHNSQETASLSLKKGIHTCADDAPWIQLDLGQTQPVRAIRIDNRHDLHARRNWSLLVETSADGQAWTLLHDHLAYGHALKTYLNNYVESIADAAIKRSLTVYVDLIYCVFAAKPMSRKIIADIAAKHGVSKEDAAILEHFLNTEVFYHFQHEVTSHGNHRSFRFWTEPEIKDYLTRSIDVSAKLQELTPYTCMGYGGVLAYVRDGGLIPHDDDLDILVAFPKSDNIPTIKVALQKVEAFLREEGFQVSGNMLSHRWIKVTENKNIDVFVGLIEDGFASFFPGPRKSILADHMFPPIHVSMYDIDLTIPRNPFHYLEQVYGKHWRKPEPGFAHIWAVDHFVDILK